MPESLPKVSKIRSRWQRHIEEATPTGLSNNLTQFSATYSLEKQCLRGMEDSLVEASLFGAHRRKIFGLWCNTATRHTAPILGGYYRTMYTVPLSAIGFGGVFQSLRLNHGVGRPSSIVGCKRQIDDFATCRQHSRVSHHFEHDICETRVHARASSATLHPSPNERHNSIEPASVSSEHTRRQSQSVLEASGLGSNPIILGFRRKID